MRSILIIEFNRILNRNGRKKEFGDLDLTDFNIHYSTIAILDLFIITNTVTNEFRIMKIRRAVDNHVHHGIECIEMEMKHIEDYLDEQYSNS